MPFVLSLMELLAIRLSPQAGKSLVMSKDECPVSPPGILCGDRALTELRDGRNDDRDVRPLGEFEFSKAAGYLYTNFPEIFEVLICIVRRQHYFFRKIKIKLQALSSTGSNQVQFF